MQQCFLSVFILTESVLFVKVQLYFYIKYAKKLSYLIKVLAYIYKNQLSNNSELSKAIEFVHFACTSDDINNTAYAIMLLRARDKILIPMRGSNISFRYTQSLRKPMNGDRKHVSHVAPGSPWKHVWGCHSSVFIDSALKFQNISPNSQLISQLITIKQES